MKERVYMTLKQFFEKYQNKSFYCSSSGYRIERNLLWFNIEEKNGLKEAVKNKEKIYIQPEAVFFGVSNVVKPFKTKIFPEVGNISFSIKDKKKYTVLVKYESGNVVSFNAEQVGIKDYEIQLSYQEFFKKCDLCKKEILVYENGAGECHKCGWIQSKTAVENPDMVFYDNFISFNKAKKILSEGKALSLTFEEFLNGVEETLHMQFIYNKKIYVVLAGHGCGYEIFRPKIKKGYQSYKTLKEFKNKAHINGKLLKDIWFEVKKAGNLER